MFYCFSLSASVAALPACAPMWPLATPTVYFLTFSRNVCFSLLSW